MPGLLDLWAGSLRHGTCSEAVLPRQPLLHLCRYFEGLFPQLCLACFAFGLAHCATDPALRQYFPDSLRSYPFAADATQSHDTFAAQPPLQVRQALEMAPAVRRAAMLCQPQFSGL